MSKRNSKTKVLGSVAKRVLTDYILKPLTTGNVVPLFKHQDVAIPTMTYAPGIRAKEQAMVSLALMEVGWIGIIGFDKEDNEYTIEDVVVPKQQVGPATCIMLPQDRDKAALPWVKADVMNAPRKIYYWGHSHVDMAVIPSVQDDRTIEEHLNTAPIFIRGIHNKARESRFDIFDTNLGLTFNDVEYTIPELIYPRDKYLELQAFMLENVTKEPAPAKPLKQIGGNGKDKKTWVLNEQGVYVDAKYYTPPTQASRNTYSYFEDDEEYEEGEPQYKLANGEINPEWTDWFHNEYHGQHDSHEETIL